jgi:hypothetical protein
VSNAATDMQPFGHTIGRGRPARENQSCPSWNGPGQVRSCETSDAREAKKGGCSDLGRPPRGVGHWRPHRSFHRSWPQFGTDPPLSPKRCLALAQMATRVACTSRVGRRSFCHKNLGLFVRQHRSQVRGVCACGRAISVVQQITSRAGCREGIQPDWLG